MAKNMNNQKVAVVTGASSGIGRAIAEELNQMGTRLVLNARNQKTLSELEKKFGAVVFPGDVTESGIAGKLLDRALSAYGRCDILINNAGIMTTGTVKEMKSEDIISMVRVNVEAPFLLVYEFARYLQEQNSGYLINISSILGTKVRPTTGVYAGTKYAIEALSEALRMELAGTGVHVTCIEPGLVLTGLHDHWEVHPKDRMGIQEPLQPQDISRCIRFILTQPDHVRIPRMMVLPGENQI